MLKFLFPIILFIINLSTVSFADEYQFKVGVSIPLTGPLAEYGAAVRNGIEMAVSSNPSSFKFIKFQFEDDRYDPKTSLTVFSKFTDVDHVDLIFAWGNEPALTLAPMAERKHIPLVVVAHHPKAAVGLKYVIRFISPAADYASAMIQYLRSKQLKKIVAIKADASFMNILLDELRKQLNADESLTEISTSGPGETDFRPIIIRLRQSQFDILGVYLFPPQLIQFYRQAAQQKFLPKTFGTTPFESKTVIDSALGYMEGAVYAHIAGNESFRTNYLKKFNNDIHVAYAANAYDFANIVASTFGEVDQQLKSDEVIEALKKVPSNEGASGSYEFQVSDAAGQYFDFPVVVKQIRNGAITTLNFSSQE